MLPNQKDFALLQVALMDIGVPCDDGTAMIATDRDRTPPALLRVIGWGNYLSQVCTSHILWGKALALKVSYA